MSSMWTIRRSATDTKVAGLCGGVARHWNVDPLLVRLACVLLALSGGIGLVLYVAGWLLIPVEGRQKSVLDDMLGARAPRWSREVWVAIVVIVCLATFALPGEPSPFGFGPALLLAVIWYFGFYKNRGDRSPEPPTQTLAPPAGPTDAPTTVGPSASPFHYPGPPTTFTDAAEAWRARVAEYQRQGAQEAGSRAPVQGTSPASAASAEPLSDGPKPADSASAAFFAVPDPVGLYTPAETATELRPVRTPGHARPSARRLRLVGLAVLGVALSGLGIASSLGAAVPLAAYFAAALAVVGLTLVAATWFGRARGILPLGIALLFAVIATTTAANPVQTVARLGDNHPLTYRSVAELPAQADSVDLGTLTVDLSQLEVTRDATYSAHVDVGRLRVLVPSNTNVVVNYRVDFGDVMDNGARVQVHQNNDVRGTLRPNPVRAGRPTLTVDLSTDFGQVEVQR